MLTLLAVMLVELPLSLCEDVEKELREYGGMSETAIQRIVSNCEVQWGPGGTARESSGS